MARRSARLAPALALLALAACRRDAPALAASRPHMARYNVNVSVGPDRTVLGATFTAPGDLAYSAADCAGVRLRGRLDPPSLDGGRVTVRLATGEVVGRVARGPERAYLAAVTRTLTHGDRVSADVAGGPGAPAHAFRAAAPVPSAVAPAAPERGFRHAPGAPLRLAWSGGDSSHVAVLVTVSRGDPARAPEVYQLSCVYPRGPGAATIPGAALAPSLLPADADTVAAVVVADSRVVEGEHALDVTPVATGGNVVVGALAR